jgi:hypothetical protein
MQYNRGAGLSENVIKFIIRIAILGSKNVEFKNEISLYNWVM